MTRIILIFCLFLLILTSCSNKKYEPFGLTKLSEEELIERARAKEELDVEKVIWKNEAGELLTYDSVSKIPHMNEWTSDRYVDQNGVIKEMIIRKATQKDKELIKILNEAYNHEPPVEIIDIDCKKKAEILDEIYSLDQDMRKSDNHDDYNPEIDRQNLVKVVSLLENCGMPTTEEVTSKQITAIWLVLQHADNENRKKYFPLLKKASENGDLEKSHIALMQDRILMMDGKPQIYGSQITQDRKNDGWMIYDLQNPETVDRRRFEVGLGPLSEYASKWNIDFNVKQVK